MNLTPDMGEILRYMGYRGQALDDAMQNRIHRCIEKMRQAIKPRFCYRRFSLSHQDTLFLPECRLSLSGKDIQNHLKDCEECVLLAVTLGIEADNLIRISESDSMTDAVIFDACATELVEQLCDYAEREILQLVQKDNLFLTSRFSPGYGDFPITLQEPISRILDTPRQIGLTVTPQSLMIPRKSVTAILGLTKKPCHHSHHDCTACTHIATCPYRKEPS